MDRKETLYKDFRARLQPRLLWDSQSEGTAIRTKTGKPRYRHKPHVQVVKHRPTEAEDNAIGRAHRRRQNKRLRGWLPYAKR